MQRGLLPLIGGSTQHDRLYPLQALPSALLSPSALGTKPGHGCTELPDNLEQVPVMGRLGPADRRGHLPRRRDLAVQDADHGS